MKVIMTVRKLEKKTETGAAWSRSFGDQYKTVSVTIIPEVKVIHWDSVPDPDREIKLTWV